MKMTQGVREDKKGHLERLLEFGTVMIFVDSRRHGVTVPPEHLSNPQLPLNLDYAFDIPDFKILEDRVEVSLSFNKKDFFCSLPFSSIYGVRSIPAGEFVVFFDDVPAELLSTLQPQTPLPPDPKGVPLGEPGEKETEQKEADRKEAEPSEKKPSKKGHLRLVE